MAYPIRIDIKGLDALAAVPTSAHDKIARMYALEVAKIARRIVPVRTGKLRSSIKVSGTNLVVSAPYAGFVEYGTRFMNAQPYIRPALEQAKPMLRRMVDQILQDSIEKGRRQGRREAAKEFTTKAEQRLSSLIDSLMDVGSARKRLESAVRGLLRTWRAIR